MSKACAARPFAPLGRWARAGLQAVVGGLMAASVASAAAQATVTGHATGHVIDPSGLPLPGVLVTVASPALQGVRTANSSGHGDFIIPFLPAGQYTVLFEHAGFATARRSVRVRVGETVMANAQMALRGVVEALTVGVPADFAGAAPVDVSYRAELIDRLPIRRDLGGPVLLAPGTTDTGPAGAVTFAGAMSYEGLFLLDGVVINETLRNQPRPLVIEDAIAEVRVMTANIPAEYGRFSGGVANAVTRSGGNVFSGSFRTTFNNERWRALTPFERLNGLTPASRTVPTHELTIGGPVVRDRLWFFAAGRLEEQARLQTTRFTDLAYDERERDTRVEVQGTWRLGGAHTLRTTYAGRHLLFEQASSGVVMDLASLSPRKERDRLGSASYTGVLASHVFLEGQYSERRYRILGFGAQFTDLVRGTLIVDRSRAGARWNAPTFCGICGPDGSETADVRDNRRVFAKGTYYWSTPAYGAHSLVAGADLFEDRRTSDNWQSGSGYRLIVNGTIIRDNGASLYPVMQGGVTPTQASATYLQWNPIATTSTGNRLRTASGFVNDVWTAGRHWSFNLGLRWDRTDARDQGGARVGDSLAWSPRLTSSWDPTGEGRWFVQGGLSRYTMSVASTVADLGTTAGRSAAFRYVYQGPSINLDPSAPALTSTPDALRTVFEWFQAHGGPSLPLRDAPTYPGVNRVVGPALSTPSADEYTLGVGYRLGSRGSVRADGIFRHYRDFYAERKDLTTGRARDPLGLTYDLGVIGNTNQVFRGYRGLLTQVHYTWGPSVRLGANHTFARSQGNFDGESEGSGPGVADVLTYPEYARASWSYPLGDLAIDERHNLRLWINAVLPRWRGLHTDIAVLERVTSGTPQSVDGPVAVGPFLRNPGRWRVSAWTGSSPPPCGSLRGRFRTCPGAGMLDGSAGCCSGAPSRLVSSSSSRMRSRPGGDGTRCRSSPSGFVRWIATARGHCSGSARS